MGKTYVVFIGREPGVYDTWEEAQKQVNKFSGASHRSFSSRGDAVKAFGSYLDKQVAASSSTPSVERTSYAPSSASATATTSSSVTQVEKIVKLEVALSNLVQMTEEIKKQIESLKINSDD